jgi:hypothetical protein
VAFAGKKEFVAMKKALAGVLVAAFVGLWAAGAMAQAVPFVHVYFDDGSNGSYGETQAECGQPGSLVSLYVVAQNFNSWMTAVEYKVSFPDGIMFIGDAYPTVPGITLNYGNSRDGNVVSWQIRRDGWAPLLISTIAGLWTSDCDCQYGPYPVVVGAYPYPVDPPSGPTGLTWPDERRVSAVGMTSLVCPGPVPTQESTWGGIKALYR